MNTQATLKSRGRVGNLMEDGSWSGEPKEFVSYLNSAYRPLNTGVDVLFPPGVRAFWRAVSAMEADVVKAPEKTELPEGALS